MLKRIRRLNPYKIIERQEERKEKMMQTLRKTVLKYRIRFDVDK